MTKVAVAPFSFVARITRVEQVLTSSLYAGPALRYASRAVHEQFEAIVLGGTRASLGMASFRDLLNADQVRAIQAYVLSRAGEGAAICLR